MAGSINLSLSQQFDKLNGNLLSGGRLYFYAAGTDSPQNAFKDTNLTLVHPNPIILASDGRVPQLYFADGSIHVRLTDSGGVVQFDEDFILVIGPSSGGGGGGGGGVDATAIAQTGDVIWQPVGGSRSGWVRCNGLTIGSASSAATERHNADCQALFEYLWNTYIDSYCHVSGSRTTALGDWNANKTIALLDCREIMIGGLSDMGNSPRGGLSSIPVERDGTIMPAGIAGEIYHTLSISELAVHSHTGNTGGENVGHTHGGGGLYDAQTGQFVASGILTVVGAVNSSGTASTDDVSSGHFHSFTTDTIGSNVGHNNIPRTMYGTFYQKL